MENTIGNLTAMPIRVVGNSVAKPCLRQNQVAPTAMAMTIRVRWLMIRKKLEIVVIDVRRCCREVS